MSLLTGLLQQVRRRGLTRKQQDFAAWAFLFEGYDEVVVRRRRSPAETEALVAEFEASGLMREAFCELRGLAVGTLDKYRRRVQMGGNRSPGRWLLLKWFGRRRGASSDVDGHSAFVVELRSGRRIEVRRGFDAGTLERLLTVLDRT